MQLSCIIPNAVTALLADLMTLLPQPAHAAAASVLCHTNDVEKLV
jgi:hypothetical protein